MSKKQKRILKKLNSFKFKEIHNRSKEDFFKIYCNQIKSRNILLIMFFVSVLFIVGTITINPEYSITLVLCLVFLEISFCLVTIREDTTIINKLRGNPKIKSVEVSIPVELANAICLNTRRNPVKYIKTFNKDTEFSDYETDITNGNFDSFRYRLLLIKDKKVFDNFVEFCTNYDSSDIIDLKIYYIDRNKNIDIISLETEGE